MAKNPAILNNPLRKYTHNDPDGRIRLEHYHEKDPATGCWNWTRGKKETGYGTLRVKEKQTPAHRQSYLIYRGEIPEGMLVCHSCDNRSCINPDHLWLGTAADNTRDMVAKGRQYGGPNAPKIGAPAYRARKRISQLMNHHEPPRHL